MINTSNTSPAPTQSDDTAPAASPPLDGQHRDVMVHCRNVVKTYRTGDITVEALRGVDLDIRSGEFVVVMGPSGHGKSTLLNCLSGIDSIDSGTVQIDGQQIHEMKDRARTAHRAKRMGFVFQNFNLIPVLSAAENVELPLLAAGAKPAIARERAAALLNRVGLGQRGQHRPAELSGGEQQRVAIARSLVTDPAVVWADEPTGNLDSATAASVLDLFRAVNAGGQTFVIVTHDPEIGANADRMIEVRDGLIRQHVADEFPTSPIEASAIESSIPENHDGMVS